MNKIFSLIVLVLFLSTATPVYAHSGRTDSNGGHVCRTNCAKYGLGNGEYHKHNPPVRVSKSTSKTKIKTITKKVSKKARR